MEDRERQQDESTRLLVTLLRVAWLSVLLGLALEIVLVLLAAGMGKAPGAAAVLADGVQKVSWSLLVCAGLSLGTAASRARVGAMGLAGLVSAPLAFNVARTLHKGVSQALAGTAVGGGPSPVLLSVLKALEYACLGMALGWLAKRTQAGLLAHAGVGLCTGVLFGGSILLATWGASPTPIALVVRAANELLFPVGCSLVLFAADAMGKRLARA